MTKYGVLYHKFSTWVPEDFNSKQCLISTNTLEFPYTSTVHFQHIFSQVWNATPN